MLQISWSLGKTQIFPKSSTVLVKKLPIAPNKLCSNTTKEYYVINLISKSEFQLLILTRCLSILTTIDEKKGKQKSILPIFLKKKPHKLPSKQNCLMRKTHIRSHSITRTIIVSKTFVFHPNNCLVLLQILVIESQHCSCSYFFSLANQHFFSLALFSLALFS